MKKLVLIATLTFCSIGFAQTLLPSNLKDTMSAMGADMKAISRDINNPQKNAASAVLALAQARRDGHDQFK